MIAAVFDCMVYLQAATNDHSPAFACLSFAETGAVRLYLSPVILEEVRDVLTRKEIRAKFPRLTEKRVDVFVQKLATVAVVENDVADSGVVIRDPDDLPYLNLAIAKNIGYLVTRDKDLLDLMKDEAFVSQYPQLQIVDPVAFLAAVRAAQGS